MSLLTSSAARRAIACFSGCSTSDLSVKLGSCRSALAIRTPPGTENARPSRSSAAMSRRTVMCETPSASVSCATLSTGCRASRRSISSRRWSGISGVSSDVIVPVLFCRRAGSPERVRARGEAPGPDDSDSGLGSAAEARRLPQLGAQGAESLVGAVPVGHQVLLGGLVDVQEALAGLQAQVAGLDQLGERPWRLELLAVLRGEGAVG